MGGYLMKINELPKADQITLEKWEKVRRSWWLYTPTQLKKLESEVEKINEKLDKE